MPELSSHPKNVGIESGLGVLEARILRTIATLTPPITVRQVCDALGADGYFAYQGILNAMNRMVHKQLLTRDKRGNVFYYIPTTSLEEVTARVVGKVLSHLGGRLDLVVCQVLGIDPELGVDEIAALRAKLARAKKK